MTIFLGDMVKFQKRVPQQVSFEDQLNSTVFLSLALVYFSNEQPYFFFTFLVTTLMLISELECLNNLYVTAHMLPGICPRNGFSFVPYASSRYDCAKY
jgi:hypothetical protein